MLYMSGVRKGRRPVVADEVCDRAEHLGGDIGSHPGDGLLAKRNKRKRKQVKVQSPVFDVFHFGMTDTVMVHEIHSLFNSKNRVSMSCTQVHKRQPINPVPT